ncbi:DeoR/GlpR family DNA-binding transcription regulator [Corynebacterium auriscanis]|uniref:DeoR/GlpR family DNA-binding transcription regulator n=1 Tax=Corynebacterium auriscanis TaxID=99807 RepID=UPI003CEDC741
MQSTERRRQIVSLAAVQGRVTVNELADRFRVTAETIRRDLAALNDSGLLYRVHGGAVPVPKYHTEYTSVETRSKASIQAKLAIGREAAQHLPKPGSTIFLDAGTTTGVLADYLAEQSVRGNAPHLIDADGDGISPGHAESGRDNSAPTPNSGATTHFPPLRVITNSLHIAYRLANTPSIDILLIGGDVRPQSRAVVGPIATRQLGVLHADVAFIGTNALTMAHGLSTPDAAEGAIKRCMVTNADRVVALCDSSKFGLDYLVSFASIDDLSMLVTDPGAPDTYVQALKDSGIDVVFAQPGT